MISPSARFTLMRLLPIVLLVAVALMLQQGLGVGRAASAVAGLVAAIALRLALVRLWKNDP